MKPVAAAGVSYNRQQMSDETKNGLLTKGSIMNTQRFKTLSALFLALILSAGAWAACPAKSGCGDRDKEACQTAQKQCDEEKKGDCEKADQDRTGCGGSRKGTKGCAK